MSSLASKSGPRYRHTAGEEEPYETIRVEKLTPDHRRGDFRRRHRQARHRRALELARWTRSIARSPKIS